MTAPKSGSPIDISARGQHQYQGVTSAETITTHSPQFSWEGAASG